MLTVSSRRCVICGRRAKYLVQVAETATTDSPGQSLAQDQRLMCRRHTQEALPDSLLPRRSVAHRLAAEPAPTRSRKKHYEEHLIYAVLMLVGDGIFWAIEVDNPSATRLVGALVCAGLGALMLFNTYVVRLRENLERERESAAPDQAVGE